MRVVFAVTDFAELGHVQDISSTTMTKIEMKTATMAVLEAAGAGVESFMSSAQVSG